MPSRGGNLPTRPVRLGEQRVGGGMVGDAEGGGVAKLVADIECAALLIVAAERDAGFADAIEHLEPELPAPANRRTRT